MPAPAQSWQGRSRREGANGPLASAAALELERRRLQVLVDPHAVVAGVHEHLRGAHHLGIARGAPVHDVNLQVVLLRRRDGEGEDGVPAELAAAVGVDEDVGAAVGAAEAEGGEGAEGAGGAVARREAAGGVDDDGEEAAGAEALGEGPLAEDADHVRVRPRGLHEPRGEDVLQLPHGKLLDHRHVGDWDADGADTHVELRLRGEARLHLVHAGGLGREAEADEEAPRDPQVAHRDGHADGRGAREEPDGRLDERLEAHGVEGGVELELEVLALGVVARRAEPAFGREDSRRGG